MHYIHVEAGGLNQFDEIAILFTARIALEIDQNKFSIALDVKFIKTYPIYHSHTSRFIYSLKV